MYTRRKTRVGVVTSDKMQKTVVVAVESHKRHPLYDKTIRRTTRYKVHDAHDLAKVGDVVRIVESRPMSREKRWRLAEVVMRREVAEIAPREIDASLLGISRPHTESAAATAEAAPVTGDVGEDANPPAAAELTETPVEEEAPAEADFEAAAEPVEQAQDSAPETVAEQEEEQTGE
jgi:small subunit ribosomal protein S17